MTYERVIPYFMDKIAPLLIQNKKILIVSHYNTIKAIIKYIEKKSDKDIESLDIPNGAALVYELNKDLKATKSTVLKPKEAPKKAELTEKVEEPSNTFWSKEMREMQIFSAEQIIVPEKAPVLLKNYCKEVIRANPADIVKFSRE